jgi:hypothetical protein
MVNFSTDNKMVVLAQSQEIHKIAAYEMVKSISCFITEVNETFHTLNSLLRTLARQRQPSETQCSSEY